MLTGFGRLSLVERIAKRLPEPPPVIELDVQNTEHLDTLADRVGEHVDGLDGVVHSIGFAPQTALGGNFLNTSWEDVATALHVSTYSFKSLAVACLPLMKDGGAVVGLDFDATKAWPVYDWMGVAKAGLESCSRYLARDLGQARHPGQPRRRRPAAHDGGQEHPRLRGVRGELAGQGARSAGTSPTPCPPPRRASRCCPTGSPPPPARSSTSTAASTRSAASRRSARRLGQARGCCPPGAGSNGIESGSPAALPALLHACGWPGSPRPAAPMRQRGAQRRPTRVALERTPDPRICAPKASLHQAGRATAGRRAGASASTTAGRLGVRPVRPRPSCVSGSPAAGRGAGRRRGRLLPRTFAVGAGRRARRSATRAAGPSARGSPEARRRARGCRPRRPAALAGQHRGGRPRRGSWAAGLSASTVRPVGSGRERGSGVGRWPPRCRAGLADGRRPVPFSSSPRGCVKGSDAGPRDGVAVRGRCTASPRVSHRPFGHSPVSRPQSASAGSRPVRGGAHGGGGDRGIPPPSASASTPAEIAVHSLP